MCFKSQSCCTTTSDCHNPKVPMKKIKHNVLLALLFTFILPSVAAGHLHALSEIQSYLYNVMKQWDFLKFILGEGYCTLCAYTVNP